MKKRKSFEKQRALVSFSIFLIMLIFLMPIQPAISVSKYDLTVATDKQEYGLGENVYVNGNLTLAFFETPIEDALVAVEVRDSADNPFVFRTRPTGIISARSWLVNFTELYPSDSNGNPKYSFMKGQNLWIFVRVKNFNTTSAYDVIICIVLYDKNSVPIGAWYPSWGVIDPNQTKTVLFLATEIPDSASIGNATIYTNAYSDFPKNGGFPYCPERSATFTITGSTFSFSKTLTNNPMYVLNLDGAYDLSFKLPSYEARGDNYTIYVSSCPYYDGDVATNSVIFEIVLIGDINGDGVVDIFDAILLSAAFGSTPSAPNWNSRADLNEDNIVDIFDAIVFSSHFGEGVA